MASEPSAKGFSSFVSKAFALLSTKERYELLRYTDAAWLSTLRRMLARRAAEGDGHFYNLDSGTQCEHSRAQHPRLARSRNPGVASSSVEPGYMTQWFHPSLAPTACADRFPDSNAEAMRRDAEALLLCAVRVCG